MPKNNFTFKDFKELEYDERTPMNFILSDLMYKGWIDTNYIMECYTNALERLYSEVKRMIYPTR